MNKLFHKLLTLFSILKGLYLRIKHSFGIPQYSAIAHNCCIVYIPSLKEYLSVHNTPFVNDMINLSYLKELEPEQNVTGMIIDGKFFITSISVTKTSFHSIKNVPQIKNTLKAVKSLSILMISDTGIIGILLFFIAVGFIIWINKDDNNDPNANNNTYLNQ